MEENKDILISVKPQYANLLVDGIKTIELRKKFPLGLSKGTKLYIYSSFPEKKVIGECQILKIERLKVLDLWNGSCLDAMISWENFKAYFEGHEYGYAIHVYKSYRYDSPITLSDVNSEIKQAPQSYRYLPQIA